MILLAMFGAAVPEPASILLLIAGVGALLAVKKLKR